MATGRLPADALHKLRAAEALGPDAVCLVDGELVFRDVADAEMCAGFWTVTEFSCAGATASEILIALPAKAAA